MDDTQQTDVAREINRHVLDTAARFDDRLSVDDHERLEFLCECGCLGRVLMSPAEYVARGGALLDGHRHIG